MRWGWAIVSFGLILVGAAASDSVPNWKSIPQASDVPQPPERGQWTNITPTLTAVAASANSNALVAVGLSGAVLRSDDLGVHWKPVEGLTPNRHIRSVAAVPHSDVIVAVADAGVVLRSEDGGIHWKPVESVTTSQALYAIVASEDTDLLVAVGFNGVVLRSVDRGVHWKQAEGATIGLPLRAVAAIKNSDVLLAVGAQGAILRSDDKGLHWSKVERVPTNQDLRAVVAAPNSDLLLAVGNAGTVLRSDDRGAHWTKIEGVPTNQSLFSAVAAPNSNVLVAVGTNSIVLRSDDQGAHWNEADHETTGFVLGGVAAVNNADVMVAVGTDGIVLRSEDKGAHWSRVEGAPANRHLSAVASMANGDILVATGPGGTVVRSHDRGAHWSLVANVPQDRGLWSVAATINPELLVAVGGGGAVLRSDDQGAHWRRIEGTPTSRILYSVVPVAGSGLMIAVGDGGAVLRSVDMGARWSLVEGTPDSQALYSVVALPDSDLLVAVGSEGVVLRSADKGLHWNRIEGVPTAENLLAIIATRNGDLLIAVGEEGVVLRSQDKGASWTQVEGVPTSQALFAVAASPSGNLLLAIGGGGVALRSRDAGKTWFRDFTRTTFTMRGLAWTIDDQGRPDLLAVGDYGEIQRLDAKGVRVAAVANEYDIPSAQGAFGIAWRYPAGSRVSCSDAEYRLEGAATWNRIDVSLVGAIEGERATYRIHWQPTFLAAGTRIQYAFTCTDLNLYTTWRQELPDQLAQTWNPPEPVWKTLWDDSVNHTAWLAALVAITSWCSFLLLLYGFAPQRLVAIHEWLPEGEAPSEAAGLVERILANTGSLVLWTAKSILLFLATSPRALNFWVNQRADKALEYFTKRTNTVSERANAVDLPALVNGEEVASSGAALHNLMQHVPLILLITGPGGTGKTTLACQLGRRAIGEDGGAPLAGHKVLPLLIEQDVPAEATKNEVFGRFHAGLLRVAVQQDRACSTRLTLALLRQGRLMPIVDGLSERSAESRAVYDHRRQDFPALRLIITSRDSALPGATDVMKTKTIPSGVLYDFIATYLTGKTTPLRPEAIHRACADLIRLLRDTPCTPLLATLWADQIATGDGEVKGVADLKDRYIRRLLLPAASHNEQLVDWLQDDLTQVAERELSGRFAPGQITRASAIDVLSRAASNDRPSPNDRFALLQKSRLLEALSESENLVRVAPDPIAEHLVARSQAKTLGASKPRWRSFLKQLDAANHPEDFLAALRACFDHPDYGRDIPPEIRQALLAVSPSSQDLT